MKNDLHQMTGRETAENGLVGGTGAENSPPRVVPHLSNWFYLPSWRRSLWPEMTEPESLSESYWLILADESSFASSLIHQLTGKAGRCVTVNVGRDFRQWGANAYEINVADERDYLQLFKKMAWPTDRPWNILHLWNVCSLPFDSLENFDEQQHLGFGSLFFLARTLAEIPVPTTVKVSMVTTRLFSLHSEEQVHATKATILGAVRAIPLEYPGIDCRVIDLEEKRLHSPDADFYGKALLSEFKSSASGKVIAYRGRNRYVEALEPVTLASDSRPVPLRKKGVYVITGGLGAMGMAFARHLAQPETRLALIERTALPPRAEWETLLTTGAISEKTRNALENIQELEKRGAEVLVLAVDVADREQMKLGAQEISRLWGQVHGIIHTADAPGSGRVSSQTQAEIEKVFAPKIKGAFLLRELFADHNPQLDFFFLCSSLSARAPSAGQMADCAANNFLNGFAQSLSTSLPIISANWGFWPEPEMVTAASMKASHAGVEVFNRLLQKTNWPDQIAIFNQEIPLSSDVMTEVIPQPVGVTISTPISRVTTPSITAKADSNSSRPLFFCIPGEGGNVLAFRDLGVCLAPEMAVRGLNPPGLHQVKDYQHAYGELVQAAYHELRQIQPHGPYYVGGYGSGSVIALELAHLLESEGEKIGFVAFIEPPIEMFIKQALPSRLTRAAFHFNQFMGLPSLARWGYFRQRAKSVSKRLWRACRLHFTSTGRRLSRALKYHQDTYQFHPYSGHLTIFMGRESHQTHRPKPESKNLWNRLCTGRFEYREIPGNHDSIIRHPHAQILADHIKKLLAPSDNNLRHASREPLLTS